MNNLTILINTGIVCLIIITIVLVLHFLIYLFRLTYDEYYLRRLEKENKLKQDILKQIDKGVFVDYNYYRDLIEKANAERTRRK